jgi:hypothetical protein
LGHTLLVRDERSNYSFAHRELVEYFAAYGLLARVDALGPISAGPRRKREHAADGQSAC